MQCSWLTLSWKFGLDPMLQRNWTTSTCPYRAATWRAVSPDCNDRRTCQCNFLCHTMICTACTPCTAWMPCILHGILLPLHRPATQLHQQSSQADYTWQTHHQPAGRLFLQRLSFSRTYFPSLFVLDHSHDGISEQYEEEAVCAIVLKQMSHFYS